MKYQVPYRLRRLLTVLLIVALGVFSLMPVYATATLTSDRVLSDAYLAYNQKDWLKAALLFSVYLDRNPELLQADSRRRENLYALNNYALSQLRSGLNAAGRLPSVESSLRSCRNELNACSDSEVGSSGQFVIVPTPPPPTPLPAPSTTPQYGAIAYSTSTGRRGWSHNYDTRADAEQRALAECGKQDCVIAAWFKDAYGAFARADFENWGADWGNTWAEAEQKALTRCRSYASTPQLCGINLVVHTENGALLE